MNFIAGALFFILGGYTVISVILRYFFAINNIEYYELVSILSGTAIAFSLIIADRHSAHISVEIFTINKKNLVPKKEYFWSKILRDLLFLIIYICFAIGAAHASYEYYIRDYRTALMEFPISLSYLMVAVIFIYLTFVVIQRIKKSL